MAKNKRGEIKATPESLAEMSRAVRARRQRCIDESHKLGITEPPQASVAFAKNMSIKLTDAGARKRRRAQVEDAQIQAHQALSNLSAPISADTAENNDAPAQSISESITDVDPGGIDEFLRALMERSRNSDSGSQR